MRLLEENMELFGQRLRDENKSIVEFYDRKLTTLKSEQIECIEKYEKHLSELREQCEKQLTDERERHRNDLEQLQRDQQMIIENIRQAKLMEVAVIQESGSYLTTLKNASTFLESANSDLHSLKMTMDDNVERIQVEREAKLTAREKQIEGLECINFCEMNRSE